MARQPQASKRYLFQSLLLAEICACPTGRCLTTPREATLSILFVLLGYFGAGMVKTTYRLKLKLYGLGCSIEPLHVPLAYFAAEAQGRNWPSPLEECPPCVNLDRQKMQTANLG